VPGGASGLLVRDYKGKKADRLVTRIDPGVVALVAELRGCERQAAEELGQGKAHHEERKLLDATSPAAVTLALLLTGEELDSLEKMAGDGAAAGARTTRWIRCRKASTGCAAADVPGGAGGLLVRDCKGKEADTLVDPGVLSLFAELRRHERQAAEELGQWKTHHEGVTMAASPAAIKPAARHGQPAHVLPANTGPPRRATAVGWRNRLESVGASVATNERDRCPITHKPKA
jgi:hypothetical protein